MIDTHRDAFIAFCEALACDETVDTHVHMLLRQVVASITAIAKTDGAHDSTAPLIGLQTSARKFVQAYVRSRTDRKIPECVNRIMNASANADFVRAFVASVVPAFYALPASVRASTLPPPQP